MRAVRAVPHHAVYPGSGLRGTGLPVWPRTSAGLSTQARPTVVPIAPHEHFVSCTTFDTTGRITAISKRFPRVQFLRDHGLHPRDLRKIDTSAVDVIPLIVARDGCFLVNLLYIKALVTRALVLVFDTSQPESARQLGLFMYDLENKLGASGLGAGEYEHRALESILINVMGLLEVEFGELRALCTQMLADLETQVDRTKLKGLLVRLKALAAFLQKATLIRNVLDELLDLDEDLAGLLLHALQASRDDELPDTTDVELLVEAYYTHCDEFVQQAGSLARDIQLTEEITNIILDANRNLLMLFDLKVTIYTLGITVATLIPGFYGMNLMNFIEELVLGFGAVVLASVLLGVWVTRANFRTLRQVQQVTMTDPQALVRTGLPVRRNRKREAIRSWLSE